MALSAAETAVEINVIANKSLKIIFIFAPLNLVNINSRAELILNRLFLFSTVPMFTGKSIYVGYLSPSYEPAQKRGYEEDEEDKEQNSGDSSRSSCNSSKTEYRCDNRHY
jgi:hypothetical protein